MNSDRNEMFLSPNYKQHFPHDIGEILETLCLSVINEAPSGVSGCKYSWIKTKASETRITDNYREENAASISSLFLWVTHDDE